MSRWTGGGIRLQVYLAEACCLLPDAFTRLRFTLSASRFRGRIGGCTLGDTLLDRCADLLSGVHRVRSHASDLAGAASSQPAVSPAPPSARASIYRHNVNSKKGSDLRSSFVTPVR